ncbi:hypothetical protein [Burkholderia pseudomallei]|uniref:hypothetical protein n=1 Tax=Burkholderia pseudomallei TaxID=28450 RepID=UPI001AD7BD56|nr:hypothetical protein [Burkholderia pseudomallei]MBO7837761.1 hypothetical protein [Burkholderia pseudomallei]
MSDTLPVPAADNLFAPSAAAPGGAVAPPTAAGTIAPGSSSTTENPFASIIAGQLTGKQHAKRISKAQQTAIEIRNLHWPDVKAEDLWLLGDRKRGGFAQVPRPLAMMMNVINDITKRKTGKAIPAGKTYLVLWLHVFDEALVRIDSEADAAFEAGYEGERNVSTFRNHMKMLKELGFIDFRKGTKGPMQYVLLLNPYKVVKKLHTAGLVPDTQYAALLERASAIGSSQELKE